MSNLSVNKATPYESLLNTKPAQFVQDNKALSGAAVVSATVVLAHAADRSQLAAGAIKKGLVPAAGLSVAAAGAAMVHDAIASDKERSGSEKALRGLAGTAMVLAGVETAGRAYGVSPVTAGAKALANVVPKQVLIAGAAASPGLAAAAWGVADIKQNGVDLGNAAAVGLGSSQATFYGLAIGTENASKTVQTLGNKAIGVVAAGSLGLGAYALGKEALANLKNDEFTTAAAYGAGAAVMGVGGAHVLAKTLGAPGLEKVAQVALRNPVLTASVAVLGVTAGAYALYNKDN
jgi:hypothetical protein